MLRLSAVGLLRLVGGVLVVRVDLDRRLGMGLGVGGLRGVLLLLRLDSAQDLLDGGCRHPGWFRRGFGTPPGFLTPSPDAARGATFFAQGKVKIKLRRR
jgi:hypothetical protein